MTSAYIEKVAKYFIDMEPGTIEINDKLVAQKNYEDFMEIVKSFISSGFDKKWGFNLIFGNDYKTVKKYLDVQYKILIIQKSQK